MDNDDNIIELLNEIKKAQDEHDRKIALVYKRVSESQRFLKISVIIIIVALVWLSYIAMFIAAQT